MPAQPGMEPSRARPEADAVVFAALGRGDVRAAATEVIQGQGPAVLRYLRSVLRDEPTAGDAFSQWAECVWRGLGGFRREASVRSWAFRLAWNTGMHVRGDAWHRKVRRFETGEASALADTVRTRTAVAVERQQRALDELRKELSAEDETLLVLRVDQGLSWREIAAVLAEEGMALDPNVLMKRFERLKARLRKLAKERGLL
jgi:RNA polymerase sigma-70 factor, ECF subfamily